MPETKNNARTRYLKANEDTFEDIKNCRKNFMVGPDIGIQCGDYVDIKVDLNSSAMETEELLYGGSSLHAIRRVQYVMAGGKEGLEQGYCIIGLERFDAGEE
ncbi:DUF3850 domain-containing protein [uncultured Paraglaciecola sp.]|mgnify:CR=1 FL=1|uniref:DUF3850 domain-containing protein n=1 Tax=uncultured Paraglaciecola sp. TaxID=1765024 RepID=UPI002614DEFC|nr:DUF3850 domain-containing protein [uncultured Paraglaciecola sp.]